MATGLNISELGHYLTQEGKVAVITSLNGDRAYGHVPGEHDRTWWYVRDGKHAIYIPDDLIKFLPVENA